MENLAELKRPVYMSSHGESVVKRACDPSFFVAPILIMNNSLRIWRRFGTYVTGHHHGPATFFSDFDFKGIVFFDS